MNTTHQRELRPLKYAATINDEALSEETDPDYEMEYVDIGNVDSAGKIHEIATHRFEAAPSRARRKVREGDVIISTVRTYLQAIAPIQNLPKNLIVSTGFAVVRPLEKRLCPQFCKYILRDPEFLAEVEKRSVGVSYPAINASDLGDIPIPLPPLTEQRAIADFLDRETARLDALVAAKERWLELLAEKRRALITRAVTRGLNPAAPLRDSGFPWLGQVPAHWQTRRLRHISDLITVGVVVNPSSYVMDDGVPFLLGGDIREMQIDSINCKRCSPESSNGPLFKTRLEAGDVLVVRVGYPGVAAVVPPELEGGNVASMMLVRKHARFCSEWLAYAFNTQVGRDQVEIVQYGAAQKQFNISHAVDFTFPFPPLDEQRAVVGHIQKETAKLDALRAATERTIELLKERRAALIAAAVTGGIILRTSSYG